MRTTITLTTILIGMLMSVPSVLARDPVPVETVTAIAETYARPVRLSGMLENRSEQTLAFKVSGVISKVLVDEGQSVQQGDVLASLDLEEMDAQVSRAQSVLANAQRNMKRFRSLQDSNALSIDRLQQAETEVDIARSDLRVAIFNRRHAVIRAPATGRVLKRFIEPNELVAPNNAGFLFAADDAGWVLRAGVTDRDIVRLNLEDEAQVTFDAYPNQTFSAQISEMAGRADASQTFQIELAVSKNASMPLLAGFIGHATISPMQHQSIVRVPTTAMVRGDRYSVDIFLINDHGLAERRTVPLLAIDRGDLIVPLASDGPGLTGGEEIVSRGAQFLTQDRAVHVVANHN